MRRWWEEVNLQVGLFCAGLYQKRGENGREPVVADESMIKVTGNESKVAIITYPEITSCILRVNGDIESVFFNRLPNFCELNAQKLQFQSLFC
ncbi:MAG: hypothetical protein WBC22_15070 [Sedimentisphaerales bacterium]